MGQGTKAGGEAQTSDAGQSFHKAVCPRHGNRLAEAKAMVARADIRLSCKKGIQDFTRDHICHHQKGQIREQGQPLQTLQAPSETPS